MMGYLPIIMVIMGMPLHIIVIGIPIAIIEFIASQHSFIISICEASIGIIRHTMPSLLISQFIRAIIGPRIDIGLIGIACIAPSRRFDLEKTRLQWGGGDDDAMHLLRGASF